METMTDPSPAEGFQAHLDNGYNNSRQSNGTKLAISLFKYPTRGLESVSVSKAIKTYARQRRAPHLLICEAVSGHTYIYKYH
jgi:hypothetical protein